MSTPKPLEEIAKLEQQIAALRGAALAQLNARRTTIQDEIKSVAAEIEKLGGRPARTRQTKIGTNGSVVVHKTVAKVDGKKPDLQELKALLAAAPNKTISLRKEGYDIRNVKVLAEANPHLLRMGGKGPWPEVTLLK